MPKKAPEEPKPLSFSTPKPWSALPREVHVGTGHGKKEGATTESPVDAQDQPKIYTIRDHTVEVLMHPDVLELHAVRVVHTPHGDERQLHLKEEGGGCVGGYGCPGDPGPERVVQRGTPAAQPETGPPEGPQRRDYGWWHP